MPKCLRNAMAMHSERILILFWHIRIENLWQMNEIYELPVYEMFLPLVLDKCMYKNDGMPSISLKLKSNRKI